MIIVRRVVVGRFRPARVDLRRVVRWRFMLGLFEGDGGMGGWWGDGWWGGGGEKGWLVGYKGREMKRKEI